MSSRLSRTLPRALTVSSLLFDLEKLREEISDLVSALEMAPKNEDKKKKNKKDDGSSSSSSDEKKKQYKPPDQTCPKCGRVAIIGMKYCSYCNPCQVDDPTTLIIAPAMEAYKSNFIKEHLGKGRFTLEQRADAMELWAEDEDDVYTRKELTALKILPLPRH